MKARVNGLLGLGAICAIGTLAPAAPQGHGNGHGNGGGGGGGTPSPAILYTQRDSNETHIMVMDADGGNQTMVLARAVKKFTIGLALDANASPDGSTVAFASNMAGTSSIYTIGMDGSGLQAITPVADMTIKVEWSPVAMPGGSSWISFCDREDVNAEYNDLFLIHPDGSGRFNLSNTPDLHESFAAWSPDASRIVVIVSGGTSYLPNLVIYDLAMVDGSPAITGVTDLTSMPGSPLSDATALLYTDWSHGGDRIAVSAMLPTDPNNFDLWIVNLADPATPLNLTQTSGSVETMPSWSPDDSQIVFLRSSGPNRDRGLDTINLDGSGTQALGVSKGAQPDWFAN